MRISLTRDEQFICHEAAVALAKANPDYWTTRAGNYTKDKSLHELIAQDAESVGSEWAVAKYMNKSFNPFEEKGKRKADVGDDIEVRWTKYEGGQLIVHEYDRASDIAVLVTGKSGNYFIAGWIPIAVARNPRYRSSSQPNWWVSQINLQPIENLRKNKNEQN